MPQTECGTKGERGGEKVLDRESEGRTIVEGKCLRGVYRVAYVPKEESVTTERNKYPT